MIKTQLWKECLSDDYKKTRICVRIMTIIFLVTAIAFLLYLILPKPLPAWLVLVSFILLGIFAISALMGCLVWTSEFIKKMKRLKA